MSPYLYPTLWLVAGLLLVACLFLWSRYNLFIESRNKVKTDFADIDVQLKRRASLIENLATIVKGYSKHEKETFENVAKARAAIENTQGAKDSAKADNMLTDTLRSLFAVSEAYPQLQASKNYTQLQTDLKETENLISNYRETYNQTVLDYNTTIQTFPNLLVANLFGFHEEELFNPPASSREDVVLHS